MSGQFVVKEQAGYFNAVAPDMKLEQSIQRSSKNHRGIVGNTKHLAITVEWQLIFHEILLISNREIMNDQSMNHCESTRVHRELTGRKANQLNENVNFFKGKGNPYVIVQPYIKLHNLINKQLVDKEVAKGF